MAKKVGGTVYFADEAGIRSDHHAGTTWGAIGATLVVKSTGARFLLNTISAVTAKGLLRFSTFTGPLTADQFIEFCKRLIADTDGPVFLVVDGHPVHRAKRSRTSPPPPTGNYDCSSCLGTPHSSTPTNGSGRTSRTTRGPLRHHRTRPVQALAVAGLRRLQAMPHIVRGFVGDPDLTYITAAG